MKRSEAMQVFPEGFSNFLSKVKHTESQNREKINQTLRKKKQNG